MHTIKLSEEQRAQAERAIEAARMNAKMRIDEPLVPPDARANYGRQITDLEELLILFRAR